MHNGRVRLKVLSCCLTFWFYYLQILDSSVHASKLALSTLFYSNMLRYLSPPQGWKLPEGKARFILFYPSHLAQWLVYRRHQVSIYQMNEQVHSWSLFYILISLARHTYTHMCVCVCIYIYIYIYILIYCASYQQVEGVQILHGFHGCLNAWMMEYSIRISKHGTSNYFITSLQNGALLC